MPQNKSIDERIEGITSTVWFKYFLAPGLIVGSLLGAAILADTFRWGGEPDKSALRDFFGTTAAFVTLGAVLIAAVISISTDWKLDSMAYRDDPYQEGEASKEQAIDSDTPVPADDATPGNGAAGDTTDPRRAEGYATNGMKHPQSKPSRYFTSEAGKKYRIFGGLEPVPLRVWADLIVAWRNSGRSGKWYGRDVANVVRRSGQGNFSWMIQFSPDKEHLYIVSYGGQGKRKSTVERTPMPDWLQAGLNAADEE